MRRWYNSIKDHSNQFIKGGCFQRSFPGIITGGNLCSLLGYPGGGIKRKEQGDSSIWWDKSFVEQVLKSYFPDLYPLAARQIGKDQESPKSKIYGAAQGQGQVGALSYTPGSTTNDFIVVGRHWTGYALWAFICRIYWEWDSTQLTGVLPSTWGEIYDPSWEYKGLVANQQWYESPTCFYKYVKGRFSYPVGSPWQTNVYPWHEIRVYAGGTYSWSYSSGQ